jgi:hypothetical protein
MSHLSMMFRALTLPCVGLDGTGTRSKSGIVRSRWGDREKGETVSCRVLSCYEAISATESFIYGEAQCNLTSLLDVSLFLPSSHPFHRRPNRDDYLVLFLHASVRYLAAHLQQYRACDSHRAAYKSGEDKGDAI